MGFYNGFGYRRRSFSIFGSFLMSLLGMIIGGILIGALFVFYIIPGMTPADPGTLPPAEEEPPAEQTQPPSERAVYDSMADVVEQTAPAVVGVINYRTSIIYGRHIPEQSSGSGAVISADGYIVTNEHVIEGAAQIKVVFPDGVILEAELVGQDKSTDLALLKVDRTGLPFIPFGDSSRARVGEPVIAIGNPLQYFQQTVTSGVISAVGREVYIDQSKYSYTYLQTDAAINSGNSGGPLINAAGEIIGINAAKIGGVSVEGIGFAIPSNTVKRVTRDLRLHGKVRRPMLGITVINLSAKTETITDRGVYIEEVIAGTPAAGGGLQAGDIIVAVAGKEIAYSAQLFDVLLEYYPGDSVEVTVLRGDEEITLSFVLGEMP